MHTTNTYPGFSFSKPTSLPLNHHPNQFSRPTQVNLSLLLMDSQVLFMRGIRRSFEPPSPAPTLEQQGEREGGEPFGFRAARTTIEIIGEATNSQEAFKIAQAELPQLILGDIGLLLELNSLEAFRTLRRLHPDKLALVALTSVENDAQLLLALRVGAAAYCAKQVQPQRLTQLLRQVAEGHFPINELALEKPHLARLVLKQFNEMASNPPEPLGGLPPVLSKRNTLSGREIEIVEQLALGLSNQQISQKLFISENTIKNHITSILRKLQVTDRTQAVLQAVRLGLLVIPPLSSHKQT